MHGSSYSRLWRYRARRPSRSGADGGGFRHMFDDARSPRPLVRATAPSRDDEGPDPLAALALLMQDENLFAWTPHSGPRDADTDPRDNPAIPSGYAYLLQLVAHDMVKSSLSLGNTGREGRYVVNTRRTPLSLETIYEGGPADCPHAYETRGGGAPIYLKVRPFDLGRPDSGSSEAAPGSGPLRDIGRARPLTDPAAGEPATQALVADSRNDDHAILSQLTALFHHLHNTVVDAVAPATDDPEIRFLFARMATTIVYRAILRGDAFARILHPGVRAYYGEADLGANGGRGAALLEPSARGLPLEFTHAAFRFGHAMTRAKYKVNSEFDLDFTGALVQSSAEGFTSGERARLWLVRWARFFDLRTYGVPHPPNFTRRLAPTYAVPLRDEDHFPPADGRRIGGLALRDLASGHMANLLTIDDIHRGVAARSPALAALIETPAAWRGRLGPWLTEELRRRDGVATPAGSADAVADALTQDPPLLFLILFEAAATADAAGDKGLRLGPIGSILAAETLYGSLRRATLPHERDGRRLRSAAAQLGALCDELLDPPPAGTPAFKTSPFLGELAAIDAMPGLLAFLKRHRGQELEDTTKEHLRLY